MIFSTAATWLVRMVCPHRVLVHDRRGLVCQGCGATLEPGQIRTGRHGLLERARR